MFVIKTETISCSISTMAQSNLTIPVEPEPYLCFIFSLSSSGPTCAVQPGLVWDFIYDRYSTAVNILIVNKLWPEWIILSAYVSFSLGVEQEGSVSYLSKLVLYPFVKHTWKISIDVSQYISFGFSLCLFSVFIPPVYCMNISVTYRDIILGSPDGKCVNLLHLVLLSYLFSMV